MGRAPCCDKANVKKGPWSPEEDAILKSYIQDHGPVGNWIALPQNIGLKRCGKSCRLRWLNYLRPNIKHGGFSEEEDNIIFSLYISIGSRWSIIAAQLPGRTDNDIKNYWNTKLKRKLLGKHRKKGRRQAQKNSSKRGVCTEMMLSEADSCSVISGTASGWSELPRGVPDVSLSGLNQNPNSLTTTFWEQSYIWDILPQLEGRFSPNQGQEAIPITSDFLQYQNDSDKVSPYGVHYPFESITGLASSQHLSSGSIDEVHTIYNMSMANSLNAPVVLNHSDLQDFSISQAENCGHRNLILDGHYTSDVYGADETMSISICSTAIISNNNCQGSNIIWEDISSLLAEDNGGDCRSPSPCDYNVHSQP